MSQIHHIRRKVLDLTQKELAAICGTSQGTVSKWEKGELSPSLDDLTAIREYAMKNGRPWSDSVVFPAAEEAAA